MKLKDKNVLITGGSKGIGKGLAKVFLEQGANVIICARNKDVLDDTVNELSAVGNIRGFSVDITKLSDVKDLQASVSNEFKHLDVLLNNASILGVRAKIKDTPEDIWDSVIKINLNSQFYVIKAFLPLLEKSTNASIINVSSSVGRKGKAEWGAYAASKFGLEGLTQVLADELKDTNIRVNSVNPGGTRTDMRADAYPDEDPLTLPTPEDISPIFLHLASDDSIDTNGQAFNARDYLDN
ncbi:MAG TPA: SDR family NAD(P)-dependent oxidoreductase [Thermodesulfobacteriota bacterium]|nr:SDR family NAD(P)-dependent oxidoreductase [Thermodesulfobacteriota bacterium]